MCFYLSGNFSRECGAAFTVSLRQGGGGDFFCRGLKKKKRERARKRREVETLCEQPWVTFSLFNGDHYTPPRRCWRCWRGEEASWKPSVNILKSTCAVCALKQRFVFTDSSQLHFFVLALYVCFCSDMVLLTLPLKMSFHAALQRFRH